MDKRAPIESAPEVARVTGGFVGYFKPEQFDFEEEEEFEEIEPEERKPDEPAPPTKEPKPK